MSAADTPTKRAVEWLRAAFRCLAVVSRAAGIAALLAVHADASAKESFGRFFFTPEERRMLNEMRDDDTEPEQPKPEPGQISVAPIVDVISFDGKVERSGGGGTTVWVNGRPVFTGNRTVEGIQIQSSRGTDAETRFVLPPSDAGETDFSLKVGQKIAVQSGKVLESYERRAREDSESVFAAEGAPDSEAEPVVDGKPEVGAPPGTPPTPAAN